LGIDRKAGFLNFMVVYGTVILVPLYYNVVVMIILKEETIC